MTVRRLPVSVVILTFNASKYLEALLDSVSDQDMPRHEYEVIVADNGSTDGTAAAVRERRPEVRVLDLGGNHGFARGNNLAVREAVGDTLVFLNQDTVVGWRWLSALLSAMDRHELDACQSNIVHPRDTDFAKIETRGISECLYYYELTRFGHVEQIIRKTDEDVVACRFLSGAAFAIRRSVLEELGYLFDESLGMYCEDTELSLRLSNKGFRAGVVQGSTVYHLGSFDAALSRRNVWKHLILSRNRFLAHFRALPLPAFLFRLPLLAVSHPVKVFSRARQTRVSIAATGLFTLLGAAASGLGFLWFLAALPSGRATDRRNP